MLECIGTGNHFQNRTPAVQKLRKTINKWNLLKLKSFCKAKDMVNNTKRLHTEWKKIFTNSTSDRGLISKIYKELKKLNTKRPHNPIKKCSTDLNREFSIEESKMAERHLRKCPTSLVIREMQIKTTLRFHLTHVKIAKIKNTDDKFCWSGYGKREHFCIAGGNASWYNPFGCQCSDFSEN